MGAQSWGGQRRPLGKVPYNLRSEGSARVCWVKGKGKSSEQREWHLQRNSICKGPEVGLGVS